MSTVTIAKMRARSAGRRKVWVELEHLFAVHLGDAMVGVMGDEDHAKILLNRGLADKEIAKIEAAAKKRFGRVVEVVQVPDAPKEFLDEQEEEPIDWEA